MNDGCREVRADHTESSTHGRALLRCADGHRLRGGDQNQVGAHPRGCENRPSQPGLSLRRPARRPLGAGRTFRRADGLTCTPSLVLECGIQSIPCRSPGHRRTAEAQTEGPGAASVHPLARPSFCGQGGVWAVPTGGVFARALLLFSCVCIWGTEAGSVPTGSASRGPGTGEPEGVLGGAQGQPQAGTGCRSGVHSSGTRPRTISTCTRSCSDSNAVFQPLNGPRHLRAPSLQGYSSRDSEGTPSCVRCQKHQDG